MSPQALALAQAAERLIGAPFRLHGRDPATGLDCAGLVDAALRACGHPGLPHFAYALHTRDIAAGLSAFARAGLISAQGPPRPGTIVLVHPGPAQAHLLIAGAGHRFIHAHAGLRRVVASPAPLAWPIARQWRPGPHDPRN